MNNTCDDGQVQEGDDVVKLVKCWSTDVGQLMGRFNNINIDHI